MLNELGAKYWRSRAEEARAIAESMKTIKGMAHMLEVVEQYEKLAELAEAVIAIEKV